MLTCSSQFSSGMSLIQNCLYSIQFHIIYVLMLGFEVIILYFLNISLNWSQPKRRWYSFSLSFRFFFRANNWQILCCLNPTTSPRFYNPAFILTNSAYIFELSSYECNFKLFWWPGVDFHLRLHFLYTRHRMRILPEAHTRVRHPSVLVLLHVKNKIH